MKTLQYKFVEFIPDEIEEGVLYISIEYCTAIHKCVCGCGNEVVTPLSPTDWKLTFDGKSITLYPSIGNWNFDCKSHYWIKKDNIEWAEQWSRRRIEGNRKVSRQGKMQFYDRREKQSQKLNKQSGKKRWSLFGFIKNLIPN